MVTLQVCSVCGEIHLITYRFLLKATKTDPKLTENWCLTCHYVIFVRLTSASHARL
jgi:hypothetical protein